MRIDARWLRVGVMVAVAVVALHSQQPPSAPYTWKSVQMVGGGFVDGIIFHPTAKGVRYARTDMGGAYRWNAPTKRWEPLLDWVSYANSNSWAWRALRSIPPIRTACISPAALTPIRHAGRRHPALQRPRQDIRAHQRALQFGGNEDGRGNGERMTVDPNNGKVLYLGTRLTGLWRSTDGAVTWSKVDSFPDVTEAPPAATQPSRHQGRGFGSRPSRGSRNRGHDLVDPRSGSKGKTSSTIYAAVSLMGRDNLFRSTDAGKTWQPVPGQPTQYRPTHVVMASDGTLYLSYGNEPGPSRMTDGGVWKLDTNIRRVDRDHAGEARPEAGSVSAMRRCPWTRTIPGWPSPARSAARTAPAAKTTCSAPSTAARPGRRSSAGGGTFDYTLAPYVARTPIHWLFDIEIDPANSDHAMFTTGYGGWETFNLTAMDSGKPTKWSVMATGIEETVALELVSPTKGAHLISAIGDYGGFVHWDLDKPNPEGSYEPPLFSNTNGVAYAENTPEVIVRVGRSSAHHPGANIGYSLDGGKTWQPPASAPQANASSGSHRGLLRWQHLGLDAAAEQCVLHARPRRHLDSSPRHSR